MGGRARAQTIGWWEADIRNGPIIFCKPPCGIDGRGRAGRKNIDSPPPVNFCAWLVGNLKLLFAYDPKHSLRRLGKQDQARSLSQESAGSKVRDAVVAHYVGLSLPTAEHLRAGGLYQELNGSNVLCISSDET
jgi:hypothetical protein